jgi:hypothetical protein
LKKKPKAAEVREHPLVNTQLSILVASTFAALILRAKMLCDYME